MATASSHLSKWDHLLHLVDQEIETVDQTILEGNLKGVFVGLENLPNFTTASFENIQKYLCPAIPIDQIRKKFLQWTFEGKVEGFSNASIQKVKEFFKDRYATNKIPHTLQWKNEPKILYAAKLVQIYASKKQRLLTKVNLLFMKINPGSFYYVKHPFVRTHSDINLSEEDKKAVKEAFQNVFGIPVPEQS